MKIVVLLASSDDVRVKPVQDRRSGRVRPEWQARRLDPAAARALDLALGLKASSAEVSISALLLGPERDEPFLVEASARGCDETVRVWDEDCRDVRAPAKALILGSAVRALGADIVLVGAASADSGSAQVGVLTSSRLGMPCVTQVTALSVAPGSGTALRASRGLMGGFREDVEVPLPALLTISADVLDPALGAMPGLLEAIAGVVEVWTLADIGVPLQSVRAADASLVFAPARTPHPAVRHIPPPDPGSPAFERIGALVRGTVQRREGRLHAGTPDEVAESLFEALRDGGWLDHLRRHP
jgi:electron transfer flavoprotein beta subunit